MTCSMFRQTPELPQMRRRSLLIAALTALTLTGLALTGPTPARAAQPLQDRTLRAVQIPGVDHSQDSGNAKGASSSQNPKTLPSGDATAAAVLEMPPPLPPAIGVTITHRLQRQFEENPQRLVPPAQEPPPMFSLPPALQFSVPGAYGTAKVNLTRQAVDNAQSQAVGKGVLIHNDTQIKSIEIQNAQDVGHHTLGNIGVNNLRVQGTVRVTPSK